LHKIRGQEDKSEVTSGLCAAQELAIKVVETRVGAGRASNRSCTKSYCSNAQGRTSISIDARPEQRDGVLFTVPDW
jgi:hypothetical protein